MKETKFTKGNWYLQMTELPCGRNVLEVITNTFDVCCHRLGVRNRHDANLIAAAPEMYEEIERDIIELEEFIEDLKPNSHDYIFYNNKLKRKTLLLAKARGEV